MNKTLEDLLEEINFELNQRKEYADAIQKLLDDKKTGDLAAKCFLRYSKGLELSFFNLTNRTSASFKKHTKDRDHWTLDCLLRLKNIYITIVVDRPLYVQKKTRYVKKVIITLCGSEWNSLIAEMMISHMKNSIFTSSENYPPANYIKFTVISREWRKLTQENHFEIDIRKEEKNLVLIMPEIMRRLAYARKAMKWETTKWRRITERIYKDLEPILVSQLI